MLQAVVAAVSGACEFVVVVAHRNQALPPLPETVLRIDDPAALDDQGPLVGVHAGLAALEADDLVYLAATDKPLLTASHVAWMFDRLGDADAVVPIEPPDTARRHRLHPLAGALRVGPARHAIASLVRDGERALWRAYERLRCVEVAVADLPEPAVLDDVNTPAQYEAALGERA